MEHNGADLKFAHIEVPQRLPVNTSCYNALLFRRLDLSPLIVPRVSALGGMI